MALKKTIAFIDQNLDFIQNRLFLSIILKKTTI
jgi:hypothetical protein